MTYNTLLDQLVWSLNYGRRKDKIKGMGILNIEGLQLMSSPIISPDQINVQEFPDVDVLAVKVKTTLDPKVIFEELQKSFGQDVIEHPTKKGFVILNWNQHYNTKFT